MVARHRRSASDSSIKSSMSEDVTPPTPPPSQLKTSRLYRPRERDYEEILFDGDTDSPGNVDGTKYGNEAETKFGNEAETKFGNEDNVKKQNSMDEWVTVTPQEVEESLAEVQNSLAVSSSSNQQPTTPSKPHKWKKPRWAKKCEDIVPPTL